MRLSWPKRTPRSTTGEHASEAVLSLPPVVTDDGPAEIVEQPDQVGYRTRRSLSKARRGWYAPVAEPAPTTTRQAEVLNPAILARATDDEGITIGEDCLTNAPVSHDPFTAYAKKQLRSPNVVVIGNIGYAKSSLLKTVYTLRALAFKRRRAVVLDKKNQGGEGEYAELTRRYGTEPIKFILGDGGSRVNLLDPAISAGENGRARQYALLRAVAELSNDTNALDKWEAQALRVAHRALLADTAADPRPPVLPDLLPFLGMDHDEYADFSAAAKERMHQAGLSVRFLFDALLSDELAGLFDGPTSADVNLASRLTTFDVSQLPEEGPAIAMAMATINTWFTGTLTNQYRLGGPAMRTNFIVEEGWVLTAKSMGALYKKNAKLSRGLGISNITAFHHPADIPPDSPAIAAIKEAETVHLYRQERDEDVEACIKLFNLHAGAGTILQSLEPGHHLLKIGSNAEVHVYHTLSDMERYLIDTDKAMV